MKWLKRIFLPVGILVVICLVGYFTFNVAYARGETMGYDGGYSEGETAGYSSGKQEGYDEGYSSGRTDGYSSGKQEGYEEGYNSGKTDGYSSGKQEGYDEGYSSGRTDGYGEGMEAGLGHGYTIKDPTYQQATTFLREDRTDTNEYIGDAHGVYVCSHFARDVCNNAEAEGLRCAFVEIRYSDAGHAIIAFNTIDEGLVYFDAITDERVRPVVGKRYYQCIEPRPGYYYTPPSFDDTIRDILVVW